MTEDGLSRAMRAARDAWGGRWEESREPKGVYEIEFKSGWAGCADAMAALARLDLDDVTWTHVGDRHYVTFACTFPVLKGAQLAVLGSPVSNLRCHRALRKERPGNGKDQTLHQT